RQDYIRTARAKGLRDVTVIGRHALKNAMIPVITVIGQQALVVIGGAVIIETIFGLPGVGRLLVDSITRRDLTMVQGVVMFFAVFIVFTNLLVDLSYGWFDPRVRFGSARR
ncbi:MAG: ABC transporter permease, partial [Chloroflexota bacterium]